MFVIDKYKSNLIYIFLILILYNLFVLPYFYKKILRCYLTISLDFVPKTNPDPISSTGIIDSKIDNIIENYDGIASLYSGIFLDKNKITIKKKIYRIIAKNDEECSEIYTGLDRDLIKTTPSVNLKILKDIKSLARVTMFYIVNNLIILIMLFGLYILIIGKVSLKLKISKN